VPTDGYTDTQTQTGYIICPMLYAIAIFYLTFTKVLLMSRFLRLFDNFFVFFERILHPRLVVGSAKYTRRKNPMGCKMQDRQYQENDRARNCKAENIRKSWKIVKCRIDRIIGKGKWQTFFLFIPNEQSVCRCTQRCTELLPWLNRISLSSQQRLLLMFTVTAADLQPVRRDNYSTKFVDDTYLIVPAVNSG